MTPIAAYRARILARNAHRAGCTVAELLARGERELELNRRCSEIRTERRTAWVTIASRAAALGRGWAVMR
jgi:hypothetical protein